MGQWGYSHVLRLGLATLIVFSLGCDRRDSSKNPHDSIENTQFFNEFGRVQPYRPEAAPEKLQYCVYQNEKDTSCKVKDLPLLGKSTATPTVDMILDRTLVSHPFLGDRFKEFLENKMTPELQQMFGAVTAVVISDRVLPSFYHRNTAAIYLWAQFLWQTNEEKQALFVKKSRRADNGKSLLIDPYDSVHVNNRSIYASRRQSERTLDELTPAFLSLLYHELAHANDFLPRPFYTSAEMTDELSYAQHAYNRFNKFQLQSDVIQNGEQPNILTRLGDVLFSGETPAEDILNMKSADYAAAFLAGTTNTIYGHSTSREDLAMLVENVLMFQLMDAEYFTLVEEWPERNFVPPDNYEYTIQWGLKNRFLAEPIFTKASEAVRLTVPLFDLEAFKAKADGQQMLEVPPGTLYRNLRDL